MAGKKAEWAEEEVPFCCESANDRWARSKTAVMSTIKEAFSQFVHPEWQPSKGDAAIALGSMIGVPVLLSLLIGFLTKKSTSGWYRKVKKPRWTPPAWVFGPAWAVVYILLGFSSWSVWTHGGWEKQKIPLSFYAATLALSLAWIPLFFQAKKFDLALIAVLAQLGAASSTVVAFHTAEPLAALVFVFVTLVVVFKVFLTSAVFNLNPQSNRRALHKLVKGLKKFAAPE